LLHVELPPPPKREPFFAPGGLWTLAYVATVFVVLWFVGDVIWWLMELLKLV
jgi:hypothetical protein